jgi:hypothetical protein
VSEDHQLSGSAHVETASGSCEGVRATTNVFPVIVIS